MAGTRHCSFLALAFSCDLINCADCHRLSFVPCPFPVHCLLPALCSSPSPFARLCRPIPRCLWVSRVRCKSIHLPEVRTLPEKMTNKNEFKLFTIVLVKPQSHRNFTPSSLFFPDRPGRSVAILPGRSVTVHGCP